MPLITMVDGTTALASEVNANWAICVLTDTAKTITVTHTWSASQTMNGGLTGGSSANITINTDKFTVAASTGNTVVGGTFTVNTNGLTVDSSKIVTIGTTVRTSAAAGNLVLANQAWLRGVNAAGTDTNAMLKLNASDVIEFNGAVTGITTLTATTFVGALTGNVTGNVTGNCSGTSGSTTGNAATATALATARTINGTSFDGTANITVTAAAGTLTGTTLNSTVTGSSLTSVGTLTSVTVSGAATLSSTLSLADTLTFSANSKGITWNEGSKLLPNGTATFDLVSAHASAARLQIKKTPDTLLSYWNADATNVDIANSSGTVMVRALQSGAGGTLTGDWSSTGTFTATSFVGNASTATALATARTIGGTSFDGTANITVATATGGFTVSGGNLALGTNSLTLTGSIASTASRVTKGWFTDLECTNAIVGSVTGSSATVTTAAQPAITSVGTLTGLTIAGSIVFSGNRTIQYPDSGTLQIRNVANTDATILLGSNQVAIDNATLKATESNATRAGLRLPHGVAPTSPVDGDMWTTTAGLYVRINGVTVGPLS